MGSLFLHFAIIGYQSIPLSIYLHVCPPPFQDHYYGRWSAIAVSIFPKYFPAIDLLYDDKDILSVSNYLNHSTMKLIQRLEQLCGNVMVQWFANYYEANTL